MDQQPTQPTQPIQPTQPTTVPITPATTQANKISPERLYQPALERKQNLIEPTSISVGGDRQRGFWRAIFLDIFSVLLAAAFGFSFAHYLAGSLSFWFVLAALLLWCAVSVIEGFLQKDASRRSLIIFLEAVALIGFFYDYAWQALAITAVLVIIALLWGYFSVQRELKNTLEVRFFTASGKVVGKVITAAVIFMVVMYASLMNNRGNFFVSEQGFNTFFNWASGFVNNFYPTVPLTGSFGDFAQAVARMQLQGNPAFQSLTPAEQDVALSQSADQLMTTFSPNASGTVETSTVVVSATEPTSNAFYDYLVSVGAKLQNRFSDGFVGAWGLILFLILRSIGIIVVWIGQFVALMFYELLLALGFMKVSEESSIKETIGY